MKGYVFCFKSSSWRPFLVGVGASSVMIFGGCRSKIDVETKTGALITQPAIPNAIPQPAKVEEVAGIAPAPRKFYSMRESLEIRLKKDFLEGADFLDILNLGGIHGSSAGGGVALVKDYPLPDRWDQEWPQVNGVTFTVNDTVVIRLFQGHTELRRKLWAGKNRLKVISRSGNSQRTTEIELVILKSAYFEFSDLVFVGNKPYGQSATAKNVHLEGWLNRYGQSTVKSSGSQSTLTVGKRNLLNSL